MPRLRLKLCGITGIVVLDITDILVLTTTPMEDILILTMEDMDTLITTMEDMDTPMVLPPLPPLPPLRLKRLPLLKRLPQLKRLWPRLSFPLYPMLPQLSL